MQNEKLLKDIVIENIIYYREVKKLSQEELSKKIGKTNIFIKKLEAKQYKKEPTAKTVDLIADALEISNQDIIKNKGY